MGNTGKWIATKTRQGGLMKNIHSITRAYIRDAEYVLLAFTGDYFFLPGGHIEYMESSQDALKRELKEEIGILDVAITHFIGLVENVWENRGTLIQEQLIVFEIRSKELSKGEKVISKEKHLSFHWVAFEQLDHIHLLPIGMATFLKQYERKRYPIFLSLM